MIYILWYFFDSCSTEESGTTFRSHKIMGVEPSASNKLYVRLPVKIIDEFQIRDLHPNIVRVYLPRQKSRRWCVIDFESKQKQQEAVAALKKLRIDNKRIRIESYKKKAKAKKQSDDCSTKPLLKLLKKTA